VLLILFYINNNNTKIRTERVCVSKKKEESKIKRVLFASVKHNRYNAYELKNNNNNKIIIFWS
jgi:hypothetical protein